MKNGIKYSILITTKDRVEDLLFTLSKLDVLLKRDDTECIICNDGSSDDTAQKITSLFPYIKLITNSKSKGLIYSRNVLLNMANGDYAISLDDDANFLTDNVFEYIDEFFCKNERCGVIALRLFWNKEKPISTATKEKTYRVNNFVGCGHVWRMKAWNDIPNYPDWFIFYGEENFASLQLFKKGWEIHYLPQILVHHRVNLISRKGNADYQLRQRRSIRAGWYLYFMFYPLHVIPRKLSYTFWMQLKNKTFKGDWKATFGIFQALFDVLINLPKLIKQSNRLTTKEFLEYSKLRAVKLYWKPEDEE
ncbi:glycosyltransferase family 2 protein [Flavobacterium sp.]|uniref:glycosyltransferase family 2 protein n=1 Tax=Flavobacterium sp. TaxID=239 RepID=UPI0008D416C9|nr:glycosyltransferase family 2 protein [Flavobacterium sp.]OGS62536.1 MAG: glycosyl transferase [Flavobacteria bacterium GWF1_32_7]HBD25537.1 glycosyl transferase [Flavobacterium sp.]